MQHDDPELELAHNVSLTFEMQKKEERNDTVTQHSSDIGQESAYTCKL